MKKGKTLKGLREKRKRKGSKDEKLIERKKGERMRKKE